MMMTMNKNAINQKEINKMQGGGREMIPMKNAKVKSGPTETEDGVRTGGMVGPGAAVQQNVHRIDGIENVGGSTIQ